MWTIEGALRGVARPSPLTVAPGTSIRDLIASDLPSADQGADGVVVVLDPATRLPLGTLTSLDLLRLLAVDGVSPETPVVTVMTAGLVLLPADAPIQRAATLMVRSNIRHLVLVEPDGRFAGLVAQSDLYSLHTAPVDRLVRAVTAAPDIETLARQSAEIRVLAGRMLDRGGAADAVCHWISTLNDLVVLQAIDLIEPQFDLPLVPWCWMLFGSEGRFEQTFFTDQDNGIVFVPEEIENGDPEKSVEALRKAFLPFALAVNQALDRCGFPLCAGQIMASNPDWCLSLAEWQDKFRRWIRQPEPEALLNASIFFDFRGLYGPDDPVQRLRATLVEEAAQSPLCFRLMASNALDVEPPLGKLWSAFRFDDAAYPGSIDLKKYGSRLFVDAARVLALAEGVEATGTVPRLREVAARLGWPAGEVEAAVDAFYVIQRLRLKHQSGLATTDTALENRVRPEDLNEISRHLLRESLQQAKRLQHRVRLHWQLD